MANFSSELLPFYLVASGPPRPGPGSLFPRRKSDQNAAGDTPVPDFCPIGLYQWGDFSATESRSFSNLQSGGQRYSACRPLKGGHVSRGSWQNNFLVSHPREYPKKFRAGPIYAGESKGGKPPLCRRGGGVHRGGTPSKGSRPYAPFCLLFRRGKSRPGSGPGRPGSGPGRPGSCRIEWQYPVKKNVSLPPAPRYANQPCIGQMLRHRTIKKDGGRGRSP